MTDNELQWLLSLSMVSLMGPRCDIDSLTDRGFYKNPAKMDEFLEQNILLDRERFSCFTEPAGKFLQALEVNSPRSFEKKMNELIDGSAFRTNMDRMIRQGRMMSLEQRRIKKAVIVNEHPYLYDLFETVMSYEFHWPEHGLQAYELANAVMLLRLGVGLEYIDKTRQGYYMDDIMLKLNKMKLSYRDFGRDAVIGGIIHSKYLELISNGRVKTEWDDVLKIAWFGCWQHFQEMGINGAEVLQ